MLFTIDAVLFAVGGLATVVLGRRINAARRLALADAATKLAEAGLAATGNLLGSYVAHPVQGSDVTITNRTRPVRPGATEPGDEACIVTVDLPLADQIVCRAAEADVVMGPLPAVPRRRTGHAPFDDAYAVFVGVTGEAPPAVSYRSAPVAGDVRWAQLALLDRLVELGLLWMRIRDGHAEIAFPPLEAEDVGRAAALARAMERVVHGGQIPPLVEGPRVVEDGLRGATKALVKAYGASVLMGLTWGVGVYFLLGALDVDAELACGPGRRILASNDGITCDPPTFDVHDGQYFLACTLLMAALTLLLGILISAGKLAEGRSHRPG